MADIVGQRLGSQNFIAEGLRVAVAVPAAVRLVPSLCSNVEVFVYSIEKPEEELLSVVLVVALELAGVLLHQ